jgi:hypothetical protein
MTAAWPWLICFSAPLLWQELVLGCYHVELLALESLDLYVLAVSKYARPTD